MRRRARGITAAITATATLLAIGAQTVSAGVLWTMTVSPPTAAVGDDTTFTFTATNLDPLLGIACVIVEIPTAINPGEVWIAGGSTAEVWTAWRSGQLVTAVIDTGDGDQKLRAGEWLSFAVTGVPVQTGAHGISAVAYSGHECVNDARDLAAPRVVVISGPLASEPTHAPTPVPTPSPTSSPTAEPIPEPIATLPPIPATPVEQPRILPTPLPAATPTSSPSAPETPPASPASETPTASPDSQAVVAARPVGGGTDAPPAASARTAALAVGRAEGSGEAAGELSLGPLGVIDGVTVWAIPGAVVGGPGLLVILWVALQAGVAAAWIPAVGVMRGRDGRHARPRPYAAH
ncbi:MAG TPA: hypothetical protein VGA26_01550 [Candidatus Limnocylindria bacterium]